MTRGARCSPAGGAAAVLASAWIGLTGGAAHAQSKLTEHYALTLAGVTIGEGDWTVDIDRNAYTTLTQGGVYGVWRLLLGDDVAATAHGTAGPNRFTPAGYTANFAWDDE